MNVKQSYYISGSKAHEQGMTWCLKSCVNQKNSIWLYWALLSLDLNFFAREF